MARAKCLNSECPKTSFTLPSRYVEKYSRSTKRVVNESLDANVLDNTPYPILEEKLTRTFNTSGSDSSIDRWKQSIGQRLAFSDIIPLLNFSGILCIDEFKPKKHRYFNIIASDHRTYRILYVMRVRYRDERHIGEFLLNLKQFGVNPEVIIMDRLSAFRSVVPKPFPDAHIQYDYFHIIKDIYDVFKRGLRGFSDHLKYIADEPAGGKAIYQSRFLILKKTSRMTKEDKSRLRRLINKYPQSIIPAILLLKERVFDVFDNSKTYEEAREKRNQLLYGEETTDIFNRFTVLRKIIVILEGFEFYRMGTYLRHKKVPRSGVSELINRTFRRMEKARYGFKTQKGLENHIKIFQVRKYLNMHFEEFFKKINRN